MRLNLYTDKGYIALNNDSKKHFVENRTPEHGCSVFDEVLF